MNIGLTRSSILIAVVAIVAGGVALNTKIDLGRSSAAEIKRKMPSLPGMPGKPDYGVAYSNPMDPCALAGADARPGYRCYGQGVTGDSSFTKTKNGLSCYTPYASDWPSTPAGIAARNAAINLYNQCLKDNGGAAPRFIPPGGVLPPANNPTVGSVSVTDINFDAGAYVGGVWYVEQGKSYTSIVNGSFPDNTWFGAVYRYNNGAEVSAPNWQNGKSKIHLVNNLPPGDYTIVRLFVNTNTVVWSGSKTIRVVTSGNLPSQSATRYEFRGRVLNTDGRGIAGIQLFDVSRQNVVVTPEPTTAVGGSCPSTAEGFSLPAIHVSRSGGRVNLDAPGNRWCEEMWVQFADFFLGSQKYYVTVDSSGAYITTPAIPADLGYTESLYNIMWYNGSIQTDYGPWRIDESSSLVPNGKMASLFNKLTGALLTSLPGGQIKIGVTDLDGNIVFDLGFIELLRKAGTVAVDNDNKLLTFSSTANVYPSGMVVNYRYTGTPTINVTKTINLAGGGYDLSTTLTVPVGPPIPGPAPKLSSFSPLQARAGDTVSIKGSNFGSLTKLLIGGVVVDAAPGTTSKIFKFVVPGNLSDKAYRLQLRSSGGKLSDYSSRLLTVVDSPSDPNVYYVTPVKLKAGRNYNLTIYGTNWEEIVSLVGEEQNILVDSDSLDSVAFSNNRVRVTMRITVRASAVAGLHFLTMEDSAGNELNFQVVVER